MQHCPGGLVTSQTKYPLQAQSANAVLLTADLPHGPEPDRQRKMTVLKDGPRSDRHLVPAMIAKPSMPANRPGLGSTAPRTHPAIRPAQTCEVFEAGFLGAEPLLQFQQRLRKILVHDPEI